MVISGPTIYIDASHDTASVIADILHWYPHLNENGVMCGGDWNWDTVREAVVHCGSVLNKQVIGEGGFWYYK